MREVAKVDTLVIGAGVAGLAVARHLAKNRAGKIAVVEQENALGGHASGRNAGMIRQALPDPILARVAKEGREGLARLSGKNWKGAHFRAIGSLLLAKGRGLEELEHTALALKKERIGFHWVTKKEAVRKVCLLDGGDFEKALFCPSDAAVEIQPLLRGFVNELKEKRVPVFMGARILKVEKRGASFEVHAGGKCFIAQNIINAAGAWAPFVADMAGASRVTLAAYKRHLFYTPPMKEVNKRWPFVWDVSHDFYFRPDEGGLLMSPCDKDPVDLRLGRSGKGETTDARMRRLLLEKLAAFSDRLSRLGIERGKAGLRTLSPDGRFVIGEDAKLRGFHWLAGLGGHGVTTCLAVGRLAGDIILGKRTDAALREAFSPARPSLREAYAA